MDQDLESRPVQGDDGGWDFDPATWAWCAYAEKCLFPHLQPIPKDGAQSVPLRGGRWAHPACHQKNYTFELPQGPAEGPDWPELDQEALYGPLGELARLLRPDPDPETGLTTIEADIAFIYAALLVGFSTLVGPGPTFDMPGGPVTCKLWFVSVGDRASGKGASYGEVKYRVLKKLDPDFFDETKKPLRVIGGIGSGEAEVEAIYECVDPVAGRVRASAEGKMQMVPDYRVLQKETEFGKIFRIGNRKESTWSHVFREAFDDEPLQARRRKDQLVVLRHYLNFIGHITPGDLADGMADLDIVNGLASRFCWVMGRRTGRAPRRIEPSTETQLRIETLIETLKERLSQVPEGAVELDAAAENLYDEYDEEIVEDRPGGLADEVIGRGRVYLSKFALLFALADGDKVIRECHLVAARALWKYCRDSAAYLWAGKELTVIKLGRGAGKTGNTTKAQVVANKILAALTTRKRIPMAELNVGSTVINSADRTFKPEALALLQERGKIKIEEEPTVAKGRPKKTLVLVEEQ